MSSSKMQPMLAERKLPDTSQLAYPLYASPKLDGVRALVRGGKLVSRKMLPIPNAFTSSRFSRPELEGLDGELILGDPTSKTVFRDTSGALRRHEGTPDVRFYCFDIWNSKLPLRARLDDLQLRHTDCQHIRLLQQQLIYNEPDLLSYEAECLELGYEGLILRDPNGLYKFGRSTMREGGMLKLKRFVDAEATVVDHVEEMHNSNEATRDAFGRTKRSSAKAGMVGKGRLGAYLCESEDFPGVQFEVGVGLTAAHREDPHPIGSVIKYKHFPVGGKERPRHAVYLGLRDGWDS